jgi:uncharacterized oligopeptide transporter (OPT) family protein
VPVLFFLLPYFLCFLNVPDRKLDCDIPRGIIFACIQTVIKIVMDRRTTSVILFIIALLSVGYGIYRSTEKRIMVMENGHEVIYGQAQHGLIAGLFFLAAICIICSVALLLTRKEINLTEQSLLQKRNF